MAFSGRKATLLLFVGDLAIFALSLWLTLVLRYGQLPSEFILSLHLTPFAMLFALWVLVFYMAGLYGKEVIRFKTEVWGALLRTQLINIVLAALFFFFTPSISIAPKTTLVIYLAVSLLGIFAWRLWVFPRFTRRTRAGAALVARGPEVAELMAEVNGNQRYPMEFRVVADAERLRNDFAGFVQELRERKVALVVVDAEDDTVRQVLPQVYQLAFGERPRQIADFYRVYGEVFDRVPLSMLRYDWFIKNVSLQGGGFYALIKRVIDLLAGVLMALLTIIVTPFVALALQLEYPGPVFIGQTRIGLRGEHMRAYKFRSMRFSDQGAWQGETENQVTRVGAFLRAASLDELPQCINILRGELSLIGPRNDIAGLAERLQKEIPYYDVRYAVMPGITGWAQINQRYAPGNLSPQSVEETKVRLAYDFFYIKNRSLALDLVIALKTFNRMFFRTS